MKGYGKKHANSGELDFRMPYKLKHFLIVSFVAIFVILSLSVAVSAPEINEAEGWWMDTFSDSSGISLSQNITLYKGDVKLGGVRIPRAFNTTGCTDHNGADWTPAGGSEISGCHYNVNTFTIPEGATVYVKSYSDGGGWLEIHASVISIAGALNGNGRGYPGGPWGIPNHPQNGEPGTGLGGSHNREDGAGQGGYFDHMAFPGGGGGGGYGNLGGDGTKPSFYGGRGGPGGYDYGDSATYQIELGAGGGAGGTNRLPGGAGGSGGAGLLLDSEIIDLSGIINANGAKGRDSSSFKYSGGAGAGGGGSGGTILINTGTFTGSGSISAKGGNGGNAWDDDGRSGGSGGGGAGGRVKIWGYSYYSGTHTVEGGSGGRGSVTSDPGEPGGDGTYYHHQNNLKENGHIYSTPINLFSSAGWNQFYADDTIPSGTAITYEILRASDNTVICSGLTGNGDDISSCAGSMPSIKLYAHFSTSDTSITPILHSWKVSVACSGTDDSLQISPRPIEVGSPATFHIDDLRGCEGHDVKMYCDGGNCDFSSQCDCTVSGGECSCQITVPARGWGWFKAVDKTVGWITIDTTGNATSCGGQWGSVGHVAAVGTPLTCADWAAHPFDLSCTVHQTNSLICGTASYCMDAKGMAYDGKTLWITKPGDFFPLRQIEIGRGTIANAVMGISLTFSDVEDSAWDGQYLWVLSRSKGLHKYDITSEVLETHDFSKGLVRNFNPSLGNQDNLAYGDGYLWMADVYGGGCPYSDCIARIDPDSEAKTFIEYKAGGNPSSLTWNGGYLYAADYGGSNIRKIDPNTGELIETIVPAFCSGGVTGITVYGNSFMVACSQTIYGLACCNATETDCEDLIDNDCDGLVDESDPDCCFLNGESCSISSQCCSGFCKPDYDGTGMFCANANQCVHNGAVYNDGQDAPDCFDSCTKQYCNSGAWSAYDCGTYTCSAGNCTATCSQACGAPCEDDAGCSVPDACGDIPGGSSCTPFQWENITSSSCNASCSCNLTSACYDADDLKEACEICTGNTWDPLTSMCCGDDGINDTWCNNGNGACVNGTWYPDHCFDGVLDCGELGIDCGSEAGGCCICDGQSCLVADMCCSGSCTFGACMVLDNLEIEFNNNASNRVALTLGSHSVLVLKVRNNLPVKDTIRLHLIGSSDQRIVYWSKFSNDEKAIDIEVGPGAEITVPVTVFAGQIGTYELRVFAESLSYNTLTAHESQIISVMTEDTGLSSRSPELSWFSLIIIILIGSLMCRPVALR